MYPVSYTHLMLQNLIILGIHLLHFIFQCIVVPDIWHQQQMCIRDSYKAIYPIAARCGEFATIFLTDDLSIPMPLSPRNGSNTHEMCIRDRVSSMLIMRPITILSCLAICFSSLSKIALDKSFMVSSSFVTTALNLSLIHI